MIAIVTGANSGMGKATVAALAAKRLYDLSAKLVRLENYVD